MCTHSFTLATLYKGLFPYLADHGYEIEAIVGDDEYQQFDPKHFGTFKLHVVPMRRMPHPLKDVVALVRLYRLLRAGKFDVVHVSTPKASLLGSIAGRLAGAPVIFVYRRCVYEMMTGLKRWIFLQNDRITSAFSDMVIPISRQIRDFLLGERITGQDKVRLIGSGSSNGIDVRRFHPAKISAEEVVELRTSLSIPEGAAVLLFLGRVCSEKGVNLLPEILKRVHASHPDTVLVVAGPDDVRDPASAEAAASFSHHQHIRRIGYVADPSPLYALADIFVFPSFFEGFGNVLLEAAAHERPSVGFDVPGVQEAIAHRETGILVPKGDVLAMAEAVNGLLSHGETRRRMATHARERVEREFANEVIWTELDRIFRSFATHPLKRALPSMQDTLAVTGEG
jgi:glycosyltransferase involved in cell wall biosynthesis